MDNTEQFPAIPKTDTRGPIKRAEMNLLAKPWRVFGENFSSYFADFIQGDPDNKIMMKVMGPRNDRLWGLSPREDPVVIDLMASTSALQELHASYGLDAQGLLAVGAHTDQRIKTLLGRTFRGKKDQIPFLKGDLNLTETWDRMAEWLGDRKAGLIMNRGYAGLDLSLQLLNFINSCGTENGICLILMEDCLSHRHHLKRYWEKEG